MFHTVADTRVSAASYFQHHRKARLILADTISSLLLIAACYFIGLGIYQSGKSTGSRKGFHVGRRIGRRKRQR
jgi:hypothetical protein